MFPGRQLVLRALLATLVQPLAAQAAAKPGAIYATESVGGAIVELYGGNVKQQERLAFNMVGPATGLCYGGPHDELYVAVKHPTGDRVYIATEGGDLYEAVAFATGFEAALGLDCTSERVLLVDEHRGVFDITAGGDFANAEPFARLNAGHHVDVFTDSSGKIWMSNGVLGLYDVTAGGDKTGEDRFVAYDTGGALGILGIAEVGGELYVTEGKFGDAGRVWNLGGMESGSDLSQGIPYTTGIPYMANGLLGVGDELFVSGHSDSCAGGRAVWDVTNPGDVSGQTPHTSRICSACLLMEELAYVHYCGDGIVRPNSAEQCDSAGESLDCDGDCTFATCGDGHVNADAGEDCDDGNDKNGDSCPATCRFDTAAEPFALPAEPAGATTLPSSTSDEANDTDNGAAAAATEEPVARNSPPLGTSPFEVRAKGGCSTSGAQSSGGNLLAVLALLLGLTATRRKRP